MPAMLEADSQPIDYIALSALDSVVIGRGDGPFAGYSLPCDPQSIFYLTLVHFTLWMSLVAS
jgi:hypothetical protein